MLLKKLLPLALIAMSQAAFADNAKEFLATYTDVESVIEAKKRLGKDDVSESELIRTHYIMERDVVTKKVIIRPLKNQYTSLNTH